MVMGMATLIGMALRMVLKMANDRSVGNADE
jgi:hypothetical protein